MYFNKPNMKTFLPQERKPNLRNKFMMFLFRASLLMSFCLFVTPELNAQSTVECGVGSCSANDMRLDYAYLGDSEKNPLSDDFECFEDDITTVYLYLVFKANTAASRYAMKVHYQIVIDGQVVDEIDECGGKGVPIEVGVPLLEILLHGNADKKWKLRISICLGKVRQTARVIVKVQNVFINSKLLK